MIEVSGLTKRYGQANALSDVTFNVAKGQIVGFLGANGAGKTTTMDILCGVIGADAGSAKICGFDITEQPIEAKKRLGYLPDIPPLYPEMRVEDYIDYAAKLHNVPKDDRLSKVDNALSRLALTQVRHRSVGNLSKGYRQRVALAQAIVHEPEVLVLDEPTEGLDPNQIVQIRELIRSLAGQHTIILSSHILSEVQNTCDQLIIIHQGKVVRQGRYDDLVDNRNGGHEYELAVSRDIGGLVIALQDMIGVQQVTTVTTSPDQHGVLRFSVASDAKEGVIDLVVRRCLDGGHGIRELAIKTRSLEDVFFQLTK